MGEVWDAPGIDLQARLVRCCAVAGRGWVFCLLDLGRTKSKRVGYRLRGRLERGRSMLRTTSIAVLLALLVATVGCSGDPVSRKNTPGGGSNPPGDPSSPGAVSIYRANETLRTVGQRRFSGWDSTVGQYDVIWSLQEGAAAGTITPDGLYTASSTGTFHLIATS